MAVFENLNRTTDAGVSPSLIQYYERKLLENMKPLLVYGRDAQKRTLPAHNGKKVKFRRFKPFDVATDALQEGITPDGQKLEMTETEAEVKAYGKHVELTDEMQWAMLDNMHKETAELLADQAALTLDTLDRNVLASGTSVQWANGKASRSALTSADKLTGTEIRNAVRTLKNANVKRFPDGCYHAIINPDIEFDLQDDPLWIDVAKYQDKEAIQSGEIGKLVGVKFYVSTNPIRYETPEEIVDGVAALTIAASGYWHAGTTTLTTTNNLTSGQAAALAGAMLNIHGTTVAVVSATSGAGAALTLAADPGTEITAAWGGKTVYPYGGGLEGAPLTATLIYGQNAFGNVSLEGTGKNVQIIVKPIGSSGAEDPLDQRGTVGWKVKGYTMKVLQDWFMIRIEHGYSR